MKIVFLTGTGRSGSTLLANSLGSLPGALSAGEVKLLFDRGLANGGFCGCRRPVRECPVWSEALRRTFGEVPDAAEARELHRQLSALTRTRQVPGLLTERGRVARSSDPDRRAWATRLTELLGHAADVAGVSTIVDSSRLPAYGALLAGAPGLDVRVVHLVRDPRAVAWSWQRATASQAVSAYQEDMEQFSPVKTSSMWVAGNTAAPLVWPGEGTGRTTVRYEDFVRDPAGELGRVAAFCGMGSVDGLVQPDGLHLAESHAVAGNPNRVRQGPVTLQADDQWRTQMPDRDRALVSLLTSVRRHAYGY